MAKHKQSCLGELSPESRKLLRHIVSACLKDQGLPFHAAAVSGAIELIEAGFARVCTDGNSHWLEAI